MIAYISYVLYTIIVKQNTRVQNTLIKFTIGSNAISVLAPFGLAIGCDSFNYHWYDLYITCYSIIGLFISPLICILIFYWYYLTRKTLKAENSLFLDKNKVKRLFAKHLIIYPLIYTFFLLIIIADAIASYMQEKYTEEYIIGFFSFGIYPILNSLSYGFTQSFRRIMGAVCL